MHHCTTCNVDVIDPDREQLFGQAIVATCPVCGEIVEEPEGVAVDLGGEG